MFEIFKRNPLAVAIALLMHLAIVLFMLVGVDWLKKPEPVKPVVEVVQARVVDQAQVTAEVEKLKQAEAAEKKKRQAAQQKEEQRLADLKRAQQKEKRQLADLEKKRKQAEVKEKKEALARKAAETKRLAADKQRQAEEKKRQADEQVKQQAEEKQRQVEELARQKAAEKKRQAEEQAKRLAEEKRQKVAEAKRRAAAEAKQKAEAARQVREAELQASMLEEQRASEGMSVRAAIFKKVSESWVYMPGAVEQKLKCTVRVRLGANGSVLLAQIVKSSGNAAFDRSVETAVRKAEPLPMPTTPELRNHPDFREHTFVFDPSHSG